MDFATLLTSLIGIAYLLLTIYIANVEAASGTPQAALRWLLYGAVGMTGFLGLNVLLTAIVADSGMPLPSDTTMPSVSLSAAVVSFGFAALVATLATLVIGSARARRFVRAVIPAQAGYNPDSSVHTSALALCLLLLSVVISQLVLSGGVEGLAQTIEATGISAGEVLFNGILWVVASLLGVGLALRRDPAATLARLGLPALRLKTVGIGVLVGCILIGVQFAVIILWIGLVAPEDYLQQTAAAREISGAINTVGLALILSLSAAVGEEIFFRGALQPVFGIVLTSAFFAVIHTQYALTPATLLILVVSLGLGYVRLRHDTWAAIIAHFVYNFIPLIIGIPV